LVEDEHDVRVMVEHVLIDAGHDVDSCSTLASATDLVAHRKYDLVITDAKLPDGLGMPIMDQAAGKGAKGFIITGYAFTLPADQLRDYDVLLKPLRPAEIVAAVDRVLRK
jgi:two-component system response regulator PilR (NtrC family)